MLLKSRNLIILFCFTFFGGMVRSQSINTNWKKDLLLLQENFQKCMTESTENYSCSSYLSESLDKVYRVKDLYSDKDKRYLQLNEVASSFSDTKKWRLVGHAFDQKALTEAQQKANEKRAVVAVYETQEGVKHFALILPGELQASGTWGFQVPNAASFMLNDPSRSFVSKSLSYAFARSMIKDVKIYCRNY